MFPTADLALKFDATRLACDVVITDGDLVIEASPLAPMLVTMFSDRRAEVDDVLPAGVSPLAAPASWDERRGWVGDALDRSGRRIGNRLWLLDREHDDEATRRRAEAYVAEGFTWATDEYGITPEIEVVWIDREKLGIRVGIDGRFVSYVRKVS